MAVSNEDASLPDLDDLLDPDIARILDEADLMEASDDEDEGTERGVGSEVEYSKDSDSGSEYSTAQSDADSEATEDVEVVGEERAASDAYNTALSSLSPLQGADMQPSAMPSTTDTAGASPGRPQMPAALLPASPEDEPIGCRTRTRLPMQHISLDELDALLGEEGDELFDEEGEQYQQFLRVLRGEADPLELYDGEDDDEDFVLDWDELMGANFGKPTAAGASEPTAAPRRSTRIRTYVYAPKHTRPGHQERPVQSTLLLQTRQLKQLLPAASRQLPLAPAAPRPPPLPPGQAAVAMALGRPAPSQGPPPVAVAGGPQPSWKLEQVAQLHRQVAQHVQLLVTSFAAATQLPGRDSLVASAGHLIHSLQGLPASMRAWPVVMSVVRALSEAATVEAALEAMAQLPACFTASLLPDASAAVLGREWLPGEDELLARGLLRFGQEPGRLRQYFLPGRAAEEIPPRIRNRCTLRAGDNPVKAAIARLRGPLTAQEIAQIEAGLLYYGRQPRRMELIAAQFMPWRSATHLARLWSAHLKAKDPASAGAAAIPVQEVHWTLLSGQPNQAQPPSVAATQPPLPQPQGALLHPENSMPPLPVQPAPGYRQKRRYTRRQPVQPPASAALRQDAQQPSLLLPLPPHSTAQQAPLPQQPENVQSCSEQPESLEGESALRSAGPSSDLPLPSSHASPVAAHAALETSGYLEPPGTDLGHPVEQHRLLSLAREAAAYPHVPATRNFPAQQQRPCSAPAIRSHDPRRPYQASTHTEATAGVIENQQPPVQQAWAEGPLQQRPQLQPQPAPGRADLPFASAPGPALVAAEQGRISAVSMPRSTRSRRGVTTAHMDPPSLATSPIARPGDIHLQPLSPDARPSADRSNGAAIREPGGSPGPLTRSKRRRPRKPPAGVAEYAARRSADLSPGPAPPAAARRQLRGRKAAAPRRKAARVGAREELDTIDDWEPVSLLALAETASRQAEQMLAADEAAAAQRGDRSADDASGGDPFDEFAEHRRRALASALTATDFGGQPRRESRVAAEHERRLQAEAAEAYLSKQLCRRPAAAPATTAAVPDQSFERLPPSDLSDRHVPSRSLRGRSEAPSRSESMHGPTDFSSHFAAQRASAADILQQQQQPVIPQASFEKADANAHRMHPLNKASPLGVSDRQANAAGEEELSNGAGAAMGQNGPADAGERPSNGAEDSAAGNSANKTSDADFIIDGILTHWTQDEDRDIMYTAWQRGGTLDEADCTRIAALPLDPVLAWPLPRTPLQIRARLDWLLERFHKKQTGS